MNLSQFKFPIPLSWDNASWCPWTPQAGAFPAGCCSRWDGDGSDVAAGLRAGRSRSRESPQAWKIPGNCDSPALWNVLLAPGWERHPGGILVGKSHPGFRLQGQPRFGFSLNSQRWQIPGKLIFHREGRRRDQGGLSCGRNCPGNDFYCNSC